MPGSQFNFDAKTTELIDDLRVSSGSGSRVATMRKALYLLHIATAAKENHQHLAIVSADGSVENKIIV